MATITENIRILKRLFLSNLWTRYGESLTPCISGTHGIGKSQSIKAIAEQLGCYSETIEATVMKEGEITGLPFAMKSSSGEDEVNFIPYYVIKQIQDLEKEYFDKAESTGFLDGEIKTSAADYIPGKHNRYKFGESLDGDTKLKLIENGEIKPFILFIDEINRVDDIVLKELMNIILNKNVNGYRLPWWVWICAAINPAGQDSNYATREMDPAQLDRFFIFKTTIKLDDWVDYAITSNHDSEIINAIAVSPDIFMSAEAKKLQNVEMTPSPRSWSMVDTVYRSMDKVNASKFFTSEERKSKNDDFFTIAAAKVGETAARTLITNIKNSHDNVKPSEIINGKTEKIDAEVKNKLMGQKAIRRKLTMNNTIDYICETFFTFEKDKTTAGKKAFLNYTEQMKEYIACLDDTTRMLFAKKVVAINETVCKNGTKTVPLLTAAGKYFTKDLLETIMEIKKNISDIAEV